MVPSVFPSNGVVRGRFRSDPTLDQVRYSPMHTNRRKMLLATGTVIATGLSGCSDADDRDDLDDEDDPDGNPDTVAVSQAISEADLTRTDSTAEIDFAVVFVNPLLAVEPSEHPLHETAEDAIVFDVAMDTHSGDLTAKE